MEKIAEKQANKTNGFLMLIILFGTDSIGGLFVLRDY